MYGGHNRSALFGLGVYTNLPKRSTVSPPYLKMAYGWPAQTRSSGPTVRRVYRKISVTRYSALTAGDSKTSSKQEQNLGENLCPSAVQPTDDDEMNEIQVKLFQLLSLRLLFKITITQNKRLAQMISTSQFNFNKFT